MRNNLLCVLGLPCPARKPDETSDALFSVREKRRRSTWQPYDRDQSGTAIAQKAPTTLSSPPATWNRPPCSHRLARTSGLTARTRAAPESCLAVEIPPRTREGGFFDEEPELKDEFERGTGPKRFRYGELAVATGNFSDTQKLGEGGFGSVYRGFLEDMDLHVAIKRVSKGSKQGRKEYASEVRIISRLRHHNLV
uniref:Protein kinase domain-containing protein n=1 Tax=Zea mays TaxID=4577 RepID=A0A804NBB7_MAIZE